MVSLDSRILKIIQVQDEFICPFCLKPLDRLQAWSLWQHDNCPIDFQIMRSTGNYNELTDWISFNLSHDIYVRMNFNHNCCFVYIGRALPVRINSIPNFEWNRPALKEKINLLRTFQ